jgi:branched-subunit amino acid ABC-type transport system permease component
MNFAHGAVIAGGAYAFYFFFGVQHWPFFFSSLLAVSVSGLLGYLIYLSVFRPLVKKKSSTVILLVAGLTLLLFFQNLFLLIFGARVKSIELGSANPTVEIFGGSMTYLQFGVILCSALIFLGLYFFMSFTAYGRKIRAVSSNEELASITGINAASVKQLAFVIGSLLAGIGGILIALERNVTPNMGTPLMISAFVGAVIGGIDKIPAAILGCLLLGLVENASVWFLPSGFKEALTFGLLFLFLILRPQGLLGTAEKLKA